MSDIILVTAATGTVGKETVKALSAQGVRVRAAVHSLIKGENLKRLPGVELVEIDFNRPETLRLAFTGVDKALLITPFVENQVAVGQELINAAQAAAVQHVVRLSASGAEAEPGIRLGREHREVEQSLQSAEINHTILRPTQFMQNFVNQHSATIKEQNAFYISLGQGRISYIDARDIADAAAEILLNPAPHHGRVYTLTGPEALSGEEVAAILSLVVGREISYVDVPAEAARQAMEAHQLPAWMVGSLLELQDISKAGYASGITEDLPQILGRQPYSFHDFAVAYKTCF